MIFILHGGDLVCEQDMWGGAYAKCYATGDVEKDTRACKSPRCVRKEDPPEEVWQPCIIPRPHKRSVARFRCADTPGMRLTIGDSQSRERLSERLFSSLHALHARVLQPVVRRILNVTLLLCVHAGSEEPARRVRVPLASLISKYVAFPFPWVSQAYPQRNQIARLRILNKHFTRWILLGACTTFMVLKCEKRTACFFSSSP